MADRTRPRLIALLILGALLALGGSLGEMLAYIARMTGLFTVSAAGVIWIISEKRGIPVVDDLGAWLLPRAKTIEIPAGIC